MKDETISVIFLREQKLLVIFCLCIFHISTSSWKGILCLEELDEKQKEFQRERETLELEVLYIACI